MPRKHMISGMKKHEAKYNVITLDKYKIKNIKQNV